MRLGEEMQNRVGGWYWLCRWWEWEVPAWTRSSAASCRWPCFGGRVGLGDPQRSLPTPTIPWFCTQSLSGQWDISTYLAPAVVFSF